jgi:Uma2 family endonuclease
MATDPATSGLNVTTSHAFIPPLEGGDRLSRAEFERRYNAMPALKKAELVEGVVYMPSPVRFRRHAGPHANVVAWLGLYQAATPGVECADNASLRIDLDNEPQPDAILFIEPAYGGRLQISNDDYLEGAPELIVEVASSSASYDLGPKLNAYRRNGVQEYIVWRVLDRAVDWFILRDAEYRLQQATPDGILCSEVFPGLWLQPTALMKCDMANVIKTAQAGLASSEHADFVQRLAARPTTN